MSSSLPTARSRASPHDKNVPMHQASAANMTNARAVEDHYTRRSLGDSILSALREAGKDLEHLTPDDLAPVDEFHSGQRNATVRLAQLARVSGAEEGLDVGCGIGGAPPVSPPPPSRPPPPPPPPTAVPA